MASARSETTTFEFHDGSDADGDGFTHLGFEGGDGGVLLAVALGGRRFVDGGDGGRDKEILLLVVERGDRGAVTMRRAVRLCLTRSVRLEAIWEREEGAEATVEDAEDEAAAVRHLDASADGLAALERAGQRLARLGVLGVAAGGLLLSAVILFLCRGRRAALGGGADAPRRRTRREARS